MAGTLFSLALSQRFDKQGDILVNAPVYVYEANTTTPVDVYQDYGLSVLHQWPMRTDTVGMIPAFWLPDGQYRVRMTDEAGAVVYFDMASVQAVGPSTGEGGGGGGSVDPNAIFSTGDMLWQPKSGTRSGWVRANARTIGSASSGATERANADTQALFEWLWNNFSNDLCPVTGGRGGSAAADYAANKAIAVLNMRGRSAAGLDDMGNSAEGVITAGTPTTPGSGGGSEKREHTVSQANLDAFNFSSSGLSLSGNPSNIVRAMSVFKVQKLGGSSSEVVGEIVFSNTTLGIQGNISSGGSSTPIVTNVMSPYRLGTWYVKL